MTETTLTIPTLESKKIEQLYTLKDREPGEVLQFIKKHSFLIPLLLEAPQNIHQLFPNAPLILAIYIDPESSSQDDDELVLRIKTDMDPEESIDVLEELDDAWWLKASSISQGKMFINLQ